LEGATCHISLKLENWNMRRNVRRLRTFLENESIQPCVLVWPFCCWELKGATCHISLKLERERIKDIP